MNTGIKPENLSTPQPGPQLWKGSDGLPRLKLAGEIEVRGNPRDRFGGGMAGPQVAEIKHRLYLDEAARVLRRGRLSIDERTPGKARGTIGQDRVDRIGGHVQGHSDAFGANAATVSDSPAGIEVAPRRRRPRAGRWADLASKSNPSCLPLYRQVPVAKLPVRITPRFKLRCAWR
jgi:hypothetical protein